MMGKFYAANSNLALPTPLPRTHFPKYPNCSRWTSSKSLTLTYDPCRCTSSITTTTFSFPCSDKSSNLGSSRGNFLSVSLLNNKLNNRSFEVRAVSEEEDENAVVAAAAAITSKWGSSLQIVAMFGVWYLLNIYFNIYNKQVLLLLHCFLSCYYNYCNYKLMFFLKNTPAAGFKSLSISSNINCTPIWVWDTNGSSNVES